MGLSIVQAGIGGSETVGDRAMRFAGCGLWLGCGTACGVAQSFPFDLRCHVSLLVVRRRIIARFQRRGDGVL